MVNIINYQGNVIKTTMTYHLPLSRMYASKQQTQQVLAHIWKNWKTIFCVFFAISWAAPMAYGGSQARGQMGAVASGLNQSHSNMGSEPLLQPTPQLTAMQDP